MKLTKKQGLALAELAEEPYDTPLECVEAIIARYWEMLAERDLLCGVMRLESGTTATHVVIGPVTTAGQAVKSGASFETTPVRFYTPEAWKQRVLELDAKPSARGDFAEVRKDAAARKSGWNGKNATRDKYL